MKTGKETKGGDKTRPSKEGKERKGGAGEGSNEKMETKGKERTRGLNPNSKPEGKLKYRINRTLNNKNEHSWRALPPRLDLGVEAGSRRKHLLQDPELLDAKANRQPLVHVEVHEDLVGK